MSAARETPTTPFAVMVMLYEHACKDREYWQERALELEGRPPVRRSKSPAKRRRKPDPRGDNVIRFPDGRT